MRKDYHAYYRVLGLLPGAGPAEIRRAYRQLMRQWHPDLFRSGSPMQTTAEDMTKSVNEAYEQLYRKGHHRKFRARGAAEPAPAEAKGGEGGRAGAPPRVDAEPPRAPAAKPRAQRPRSVRRAARPQRPRSPRTAGAGRILWRALCLLAVAVGLAAASIPAFQVVRNSAAGDPPGAPGAPAPPAPAPEVPGRPAPAGIAPGRSAAPRGLPPFGAAFAADPPDSAGDQAGSPDPFRRAEALLEVFEVGDGKARVLEVQGKPDDAGDAVFRYGSSLVFFSDGRVRDWTDRQPRLRVRGWPEIRTPPLDTFTLGSSRAEVIRAQGEPSSCTLHDYYYGASAVHFSDGGVEGWDPVDVRLRFLLLPAAPFSDPMHPGSR